MSQNDRLENMPGPGEGTSGMGRGGHAVSSRAGVAVGDEDTVRPLGPARSPVGFWTWDFTTDTVWHSEEMYRVHGVRPGGLGDCLGDYLAFVHPDDKARVTEGAWAAAAGESVPMEYRFVHPDGGVRHLFGRSALVRDQAGNTQRLVGTVQDLTEVRRARRNLTEALTRLSAYFDETPTPAYLWRREGDDFYLRRFNKAALARWGDQATTLEGAPASELCADRPDLVADLEECLRTQSATSRETYYESEALGRRLLIMTYVPVAPDAVVAHAEDLSELLAAGQREERAMARLAEYFERVPTPAYLWQRKGDKLVLEAANRAGHQATEGRVGDIIGITADEMYADRPDIIDDLRRALGGETFTRETHYVTYVGNVPLDLLVTYVHIAPDTVVVHTRDVTQQRLMESALRESHEAARGILDACTQPIALCDVDGTLRALNDAAGVALGVPREELLGRRIYDFLRDETAEGGRAAVKRVVEERTPAVVEEVHGGRYFKARLYPLVDEDGEVTRVVIYAEDVTEERRARDELVQSRERLEEAQRIGHLGHWDWNVDSDRLTWSDELYRIFGVDPPTEASFNAFMDCVHPEDRGKVLYSVQRAIDEGGRYSFEHRVRRPDGAIRFVLEQGEVRTEELGERIMAGTVLDITQLKRAEQAIRDREAEMTTIIERNPDGICLIVGGRIRVCNGSMAALVGCSKEHLVGKVLHDFMVPGDREKAQSRGRALLEGAHAEPNEYTLVRCDGSHLPVEIYGAGFEFRGEPALICTLRDVSKRRQAERDLAESRDALRALTQHLESVREKERVQVARDLHDELGSVLTALKIDLEELMSGEAGEDEEEDLLETMSQLVDQAIEVGRRVTSRMRPGILDDLGLAAAAEWLAADFQKRSGVRCAVVLPETETDLPEPVATTMFRILQEALTNVIRHASAESVEVVLETDTEGVTLTVSDTGRGFTPDEDDVRGFGLLGMRERVRAFGGSFDVASVPGEGTTIRVALPLGATTP